MQQDFILKESPLLKIELREKEFEIINKQYKFESGIFEYSKLYSIEYKGKTDDHYGTFLIFLFSLFTPLSAKSSKIKERIIMNYDKEQRKILLFDFNLEETKRAIAEIRKRMDKKYLQ